MCKSDNTLSWNDQIILAKYNRYEEADFWQRRYYDLTEHQFYLGVFVVWAYFIFAAYMGWLL